MATSYPIAEAYLQCQSDCDRVWLHSWLLKSGSGNGGSKGVELDWKAKRHFNDKVDVEVDLAAVY